MNYTILSTDEPHGNLKLDICKSGDKFTVGIWDKEKHESTIKTFDNLLDACEVYEKISEWMIFGYYTDDAKKKFLLTGTME